jgi:transcriptional regulator with XRE-family HTH domain
MKTEEDDALCKAFGMHLAKVRKSREYSQDRLAHEAGFGRSYVGDVERGLRNISLVNLFKIADTLQIDVSNLLNFERPLDTKNHN